MTADQIRQVVTAALCHVAPEADPSAISGSAPLREALDLDSMDFLQFVVALHQRTGVDVPEADYPKLATVDACVGYLASRMNLEGRP